jgi:hypothetical protein
MKLSIQALLDSFDGSIPETFTDTLGKLDAGDEIIRKQVPDRLLRFDEGETAMVGVISDLRKDRDNEVVLPEGMDDSNYSGVVLWQHDYWRAAIPHARSLWRQAAPVKGEPYEVLAKTQYLSELSDLGHDVYQYRKAEHPLGQSIGFRPKESVRRGQTGYEEVYKAWKPRVKAMLKEKGIKAAADEFSEPSAFLTEWELWEYSDVFIGSNPDALQIAVSKGIMSPEEAKALVSFKAEDKPDDNQVAELLERIEGLEAELELLKSMPTVEEWKKQWDEVGERSSLNLKWDERTIQEIWDSNIE